MALSPKPTVMLSKVLLLLSPKACQSGGVPGEAGTGDFLSPSALGCRSSVQVRAGQSPGTSPIPARCLSRVGNVASVKAMSEALSHTSPAHAQGPTLTHTLFAKPSVTEKEQATVLLWRKVERITQGIETGFKNKELCPLLKKGLYLE